MLDCYKNVIKIHEAPALHEVDIDLDYMTRYMPRHCCHSMVQLNVINKGTNLSQPFT